MATEFTVILAVRQKFGGDSSPFPEEENAPFVGASKDFEFSTPNVDRGAPAILLFQAYGVSHNKNQITINNQIVFGGIPRSIDFVGSVKTNGGFITPDPIPFWNGNVMLVTAGVLRENPPNVLHIEARDQNGGTGGSLDNFIIDNAVILYKVESGILDGGVILGGP